MMTRRCIISDDTGMEKAATALAALKIMKKIDPLLVICRLARKEEWQEQIQRWLPEKNLQIVEAHSQLNFQAEILLIHPEALRRHLAGLQKFSSRPLLWMIVISWPARPRNMRRRSICCWIGCLSVFCLQIHR